MSLSTLHNRKLATLLSLLALVLFIVVSNVHTNDQVSCGENDALLSSGQNAHARQVHRAATEHHQPHCVACEMMLLGAGNTIVAPAIHVQIVTTQEALVSAATHFTHLGCCLLLPSRAPPA